MKWFKSILFASLFAMMPFAAFAQPGHPGYPGAAPAGRSAHPGPAPVHIAPLAPNEFDQLLKRIDYAPLKASKLARVREVQHHHFTSQQVSIIMQHLTFDSDRIDAAAMLYNNVIDKENWHVVYRSLKHKNSHDQLNRRIHR